MVNMRARFGLGLFAGLLLGFLVVGSAALYPASQSAGRASALAPYQAVFQVSSNVSQVSSSSTATYMATTTAVAPRAVANSSATNLAGISDTFGVEGSSPQGNGSGERAILASQVDNLPRQPFLISLAAFLPVVAAVLFGAVIYRVSMTRQENEAPPPS